MLIDAAVVLFIGLLVLYHLKKKLPENIKEEQSKKTKRLFPRIDDKSFFEKISHILRNHISQETNIDALTITSEEILQKLQEKKYYRIKEVKEVLEACDLARFAKQEVDRKKFIELVKHVIE